MKVKMMQLWSVQYYITPGNPPIKNVLPPQVYADSFDEARAKVVQFLEDKELSDTVKVNGVQPTGHSYLI